MADNNQHDKDNLIDLASQRRKYQNRPAQTGPRTKLGPQPAYKKQAIKGKEGPRWYHYVQLIAFLGFLAWVMQYCQR